MSTPLDRNRMGEEASPYLREFASHPINWQPWDASVLAAAEAIDRPVFVSLGFLSCHFCQTAAVAFDDETFAAVLNDGFVPVVVDSQERPDVDLVYQTVCREVHGQSGWPLSVVLTPDGHPFHVELGVPSSGGTEPTCLQSALEAARESWDDPEARDESVRRAETWANAASETLEPAGGGVPTHHGDVLTTGAKALVRRADREHGGWGDTAKFPHESRISLLLRAFHRTGREVYRVVATDALDAMAHGGLYDHLGGGFHRYAVDRGWTVPRFEKLLATQALLARVYLSGFQITEDERYATVVEETLGFVERELGRDDGGFYSGLGARGGDGSGANEGGFYTWTPTEIRETFDSDGGLFSTASVDDRDAELFCERYGVLEDGPVNGSTVLGHARSPAQIAETRGLARPQVEAALDRTHDRLRAARARRVRPRRDEQVLVSWNGLAVSAFAAAAVALEEAYVEPAVETVEFLRERLWDGSTNTLSRRLAGKQTGVEALLSDYAFLGRGALDCYQVTGTIDHLEFALELARAIEREFWDDRVGSLSVTPRSAHGRWPRLHEVTDHVTPSSTAVAVEFLAALGAFDPTDRFAEIAATVVRTHERTIHADPLRCASFVIAADAVGCDAADRTVIDEAPLAAVSGRTTEYLLEPRTLVWLPADETERERWRERLGLSEPLQVWCGAPDE